MLKKWWKQICCKHHWHYVSEQKIPSAIQECNEGPSETNYVWNSYGDLYYCTSVKQRCCFCGKITHYIKRSYVIST